MKLENIDDLIDGNGQVTLGAIGPVQCAAVATDGTQALAMLVRRDGESLAALLRRLDNGRCQDSCRLTVDHHAASEAA